MDTVFVFKTLEDLEELFENAKSDEVEYIAIIIITEGYESSEIVINTNVNFDKKLEHYKTFYNNDLTLKIFNGTKLLGGTYGNSLNEIEKCLFE